MNREPVPVLQEPVATAGHHHGAEGGDTEVQRDPPDQQLTEL